jgi:tRNA(fMet)-specific endonuclease VapC
MYILDTDTLTHLHAGHPQVAEHLRNIADPHIGITIITKIELLQGRFDFMLKAADRKELLKAQYWLYRTEELLAQLSIIPVDEPAAIQFDRLRVERKFHKIGRADLLIASITLARRATLVTRNIKHFRQFPGLHVINWME